MSANTIDKSDKSNVYKLVPTNEKNSLDEQHDKKPTSSLNSKQLLGGLLGLLHYICAGILSGYSSVLTTQLHANPTIPLTEAEGALIASIVIVPTAPSCLLAGFLLTKLSKRTILIIITLVEIVSWVIIYMSTSLTAILIGRFLSGIPSSMGSPIVPAYLGEISHPKMRGMYLSIVMLGISIGVLFIHTLGAYCSWNTCALITVGILLAYLALICALRETHVWHLRNDEPKRAEEAFFWYRGRDDDARREIEKLVSRQHEQASTNYTFVDMLRICASRLLMQPLAITVVAMATMHFSGNKAIMFHSISIVSNVIPSLDKYTSTIIIDAIRIAVTLVGSYLIRRFPIRPLFIISGIGSALSHFTVAAFMYYAQKHKDPVFSILALIALISYIAFSSIGLAPLPWVIAGEIFPMIVKGIGAGLCCFAYFSIFFVVVQFAPDLQSAFGDSGRFFFFGCCTVLGTAVTYFILPETKNKTLKEIEDLFR